MDERAVSINIGGKDYELILTTREMCIRDRTGPFFNFGYYGVCAGVPANR